MIRSILVFSLLIISLSGFSASANAVYTGGKTNLIEADPLRVKRIVIKSVGLNPVTISTHKNYTQIALVTATASNSAADADRLAQKLNLTVSPLTVANSNWEQIHITTNPAYYEQTRIGRADVYDCAIKIKNKKIVNVTGACYTSIVLQLPISTKAEVSVDGTLITSQLVPWTSQEFLQNIKNAREDSDRFKMIESHLAVSKKSGLPATMTCEEIKNAVREFESLGDGKIKGFAALIPMTSDRENLDKTITYLFTFDDVVKAREIVRTILGWTTADFLKALHGATYDRDKMNVVNAHLSKTPPLMNCEEFKTALNEFPFSNEKLTAFSKLLVLVSDRENLENLISSVFTYFDAEKARKIAGLEKKP
jgi:hypothetical protein